MCDFSNHTLTLITMRYKFIEIRTWPSALACSLKGHKIICKYFFISPARKKSVRKCHRLRHIILRENAIKYKIFPKTEKHLHIPTGQLSSKKFLF